MEPDWCYPCRIEGSGVGPRAGWGLDTGDHQPSLALKAPMAPDQAEELRFLCAEFAEPFDDSFTEGEAATVIGSFLDEPMSESQSRTLTWLCERAGTPMDDRLSYGRARTSIRRLIAVRGLRSA